MIHWNAEEGAALAAELVHLHHEITAGPLDGQKEIKAIRESPPDLIIIDLSRLPSQGRDLALLFRRYSATRQVPLILLSGAVDKVARIKELLPDALYGTSSDLVHLIHQALTMPVSNPVVPDSAMAAYADTPLVKKLGIKSDTKICLVDPPESFESKLEPLPEGIEKVYTPANDCSLAIWFVPSKTDLYKRIEDITTSLAHCPLWIAWRKQRAGVTSDLTQPVVRRAGLDISWVDYKICAIDETWSALLFTRRKMDRDFL